MVEASPTSALVMSETDFLLKFLVIPFDTPAQFGKIDQFGEGNVFRQGRKPIFGRLRLTLRPFDQQPFLGPRLGEPLITMGRADTGPWRNANSASRPSLRAK